MIEHTHLYIGNCRYWGWTWAIRIPKERNARMLRSRRSTSCKARPCAWAEWVYVFISMVTCSSYSARVFVGFVVCCLLCIRRSILLQDHLQLLVDVCSIQAFSLGQQLLRCSSCCSRRWSVLFIGLVVFIALLWHLGVLPLEFHLHFYLSKDIFLFFLLLLRWIWDSW